MQLCLILNQVEIRRLNETRKETDPAQGRLSKEMSELPTFSASDVAEIELATDNRKGKVMGFREKCWQLNANKDNEDPTR